mgnify:FL=1
MVDHMKLIIIADIFGKTPALLELAQCLAENVQILDPYDGKMMGFASEAQAYDYFTQNVGLDAYYDKVRALLLGIDEPFHIIAFSVGASVAWRLSEQVPNKYLKSATCFYGSQIRHYLAIAPKIPIHLIFPAQEAHFSVEQVMAILKDRANVSIEQVPYLHGFMNKHSVNFNREGYQAFSASLANIHNPGEESR